MPFRAGHQKSQNLGINSSALRSVAHKNLVRSLLEYSFMAKQSRNVAKTFIIKSGIIINPVGVSELLEELLLN